MKSLEDLRIQLIKDYPGDTPAFTYPAKSPEETKFFFEGLVIPAFEKIKYEFAPFHLRVNIKNYSSVSHLTIKDGCTYFFYSIKISRKYACVILTASYRDHSICSYDYEDRRLVEERFDLSKISQNLSEELIITIFSQMFINREAYLKRIVDIEQNMKIEKEELLREERRAKLIILRNHNSAFDPIDEFKKYLDLPEYEDMRRWLDYQFTITGI